MPAHGLPEVSERATGSGHPRGPAAAERLRLPLYTRSQERMSARWGFDLNCADASGRAEALLAEAPADVDRLVLAAAVRSSRGDDAGALGAAQSAVALDERSARAQTTLAALLARAGDGEAARRHAQTAVDIDPDDPSALYNLGLARWSLGDRRGARADLSRAAELLGIAVSPW